MTILNKETRTVQRVDDSYVELCVLAGLSVQYAKAMNMTEEELLSLSEEREIFELNFDIP